MVSAPSRPWTACMLQVTGRSNAILAISHGLVATMTWSPSSHCASSRYAAKVSSAGAASARGSPTRFSRSTRCRLRFDVIEEVVMSRPLLMCSDEPDAGVRQLHRCHSGREGVHRHLSQAVPTFGGMRCTNGHDNPDGQRFCGECGAPLDAPTPEIPPPPPPNTTTAEATDAAPTARRHKRLWLVAAVIGLVAIVVIAIASGGDDTSEKAKQVSGDTHTS